MERASQPSRACLRASPVTLTGFAAVLAVTTAASLPAADYDWSDPGRKETSAVLAAVRESSPADMEALLYDGLEVDQRLPQGGASVPVISLAVIGGSEKAVQFLLAQGADIDAMSTGIVEDSASFNDSLRRLSK